MEYTIIHNDLVNNEIKPKELLNRYHQLLKVDIERLFDKRTFVPFHCPTNGETKIIRSFEKLGMTYVVSQTYGNVYLSPRPNPSQLLNFYKGSSARKFWLQEIWKATEATRQQKIIRPLIEWARTFIQQYLANTTIFVAEYSPMQWAYYQEVLRLGLKWEYASIYPMFAIDLCEDPHYKKTVVEEGERTNQLFDAVFLFDSLDRSPDPSETMQWVLEHLKPKGLCFITCLLSSGLEAQVLGADSNVFMPPERMNIFSYEGLVAFIKKCRDFQILEFSTPGVLDLPNIIYAMEQNGKDIPAFLRYIIETRKDPNLFEAFQDFLQMNQLSSYGRLVLRKM